MSVDTTLSIAQEIHALTTKPSPMDALTGASTKTAKGKEKPQFDLEALIEKFSGLTLSELQERCPTQLQQTLLPKVTDVLCAHGALVPQVHVPPTKDPRVILQRNAERFLIAAAKHVLTESPETQCNRLKRLEPFLDDSVEAPRDLKVRAQDVCVNICGQIFFTVMRITLFAETLDEGPQKKALENKRTELGNAIEKSVTILEKTFGSFGIIEKGGKGNWYIQAGPRRDRAIHIFNQAMKYI